jgi:tRNA threonylcarbamoyladenosine biosynthesis protein TsaE
MKVKNLDQLQELSISIADRLNSEDCIFLFGEIGVGKTTFARYLINYLQKKNDLSQNHVLSPTFNIVYDYDVKSHIIMHYDLYRLKSENEIKELGIFEESRKTVKIIEWPELIKSKIESKLEFHFFYGDKLNSRNIEIFGFGKWKNFKLDGI